MTGCPGPPPDRAEALAVANRIADRYAAAFRARLAAEIEVALRNAELNHRMRLRDFSAATEETASRADLAVRARQHAANVEYIEMGEFNAAIGYIGAGLPIDDPGPATPPADTTPPGAADSP